MNPLSPLTYHRRHKRSALLLLSLITLTTLGLYVMVAVLDSLTLMNTEISYLKRVSKVIPNGDPLFEPGVISRIQSHPDVERVIPENGLWISQPALVNPYNVSLLGIPQDDLQYLIDRCGMRIKEGRLLKPRTNEIVLSEEVARALGLQLGDQIAQSIDPEAYFFIQTPMVLVGILEGDPSAGPGPLITNRSRMVRPASAETSAPDFQTTRPSSLSPKISTPSFSSNPGIGWPAASCISTWIDPTADVE
jgi:hypothetical protein